MNVDVYWIVVWVCGYCLFGVVIYCVVCRVFDVCMVGYGVLIVGGCGGGC